METKTVTSNTETVMFNLILITTFKSYSPGMTAVLEVLLRSDHLKLCSRVLFVTDKQESQSNNSL